MDSEFVDGWTIAQTLGEGAFGEVKLLLNRSTGDAVAMKTVDLEKHPDARTSMRKEVVIHRILTNPHIIRYFGQRREGNIEYIFLEYAAGGELFDKIEPDVGMPPREAQKYFAQLLSGVEYLHSRGVAHRDLKPENLLLDDHDNLKISDFGLATMFRMHGKERLLDKRCGTLPYVSPEVLTRPYSAEPADVWSCGIILVAMLAGELPWDQPTADCQEYAAWKDNRYLHITPWSKLEPVVLSLVRKILVPYPSSRYTILAIKAHGWCRKRFSAQFGARNYEPRAKRACPGVSVSPPDCAQDGSRVCHSQPEPQDCGRDAEPAGAQGEGVPFSFSQPAALDDLLLSSQFNCTQTSTQPGQPTYQKLVKRMTRFFVRVSCEEASRQLCAVLEKNACSWKVHTVNMITITSQDKRKMLLVFKASILDMDGRTLVDLRLSKGCGLEFKRKFLRIRQGLGDAVLQGPVTWPIAQATGSLP